MPCRMKLWEVQGADLREIAAKPVSDEERLKDWLVEGARTNDKVEWVLDHSNPVLANGRSTISPLPTPTIPPAFQETRTLAEQGDAAAQAALGFRYELGMDAPVDGAKAVEWYRKAAEQGNLRAQCNLTQISALGFMYERGMNAPRSGPEAIKRCRQQAEQGNACAQFSLGQIYEWGDGAPQDSAEAVKWYRKAADQGGAAAQFKLGSFYCDGQGVPQNTVEAVKWWRRAAAQDEAAAQFKLGLCYCNGQGVEQNYAEAMKWYRKAAEQGDASAQSKMGDAYYIGVGVAANLDEAAKWYRAAAEQGEASAQRHLGIMHGLGQGVPLDYAEAYKWYTLAAAQCDSNAIHNRDSIADSMTPSQIELGQQLAQETLARKGHRPLHDSNGHGAITNGSLGNEQRTSMAKTDPTAKAGTFLGIDMLLVGRQVMTTSGGCIDFLAIDSQANLVVLALKRDETTHQFLTRTLDHASWVNDLSYEQIDAITRDFTGKPLQGAFKDYFGVSIPTKVNASHSVQILAPEWDDATERIVGYLAAQHNVPIAVHSVALFKTSFGEFLGHARATQCQ